MHQQKPSNINDQQNKIGWADGRNRILATGIQMPGFNEHLKSYLSEDSFHLLLTLNDGLFFYDVNGKLISSSVLNDENLKAAAHSSVYKSLYDCISGCNKQELKDFIYSENTRELFSGECQYCPESNEIFYQAKLMKLRSQQHDDTLLMLCLSNFTKEKNETLKHLRQAQEQQEEYNKLLEIVEFGTEIIFKLDQEGRFIFLSSEIERGLGYKKEDLIGKTFVSLIAQDDLKLALDMYSIVTVQGLPGNNIVIRVKHANGSYIPLNCSVTSKFDKNGCLLYSIGFAQDVTEIQQQVDTLRASEKRYSAFINHSSEAIGRFETKIPLSILVDPSEMISTFIENGYLAECNNQLAIINGYEKAEEIIGLPVRSLLSLRGAVGYKNLFRFIESGFNLVNAETIDTDESGNKHYYINNLTGIVENGYLLRVWGTQREITRQRNQEQNIRFMAGVMDNISDAVVSTDLEFRINAWNKAAEKIYSYTAEEMAGKQFRELINLVYTSHTPRQVMEGFLKHDRFETEAYYDHPSGKRIFLFISYSYVTNDKMERIGIAGIHRDITAWRQSTEALRISEERYRSLVDALGEGIILIDSDMKLVAYNKSAAEILGWPEGHKPDISGGDSSGNVRLLHEDGTRFPFDQLPGLTTLKTGESIRNEVIGIQRAGKSDLWLSVNTEPIFYSGQREKPDAVVASIIDITESRKAKIQLEANERELRHYSSTLTNMLQSISDGFIAVDKEMKVLIWNKVIEMVTTIPPEFAVGKSLLDVFPNLSQTEQYRLMVKAIETNHTQIRELFDRTLKIWYEMSVYPSSEGLFVYFRDVTVRREHERFLSLEKDVLELMASPDTSLKIIVDYYLKGVEKIFPNMMMSVITLSEDETSIVPLASSEKLIRFNEQITGAKIGPFAGSCGTALYLKEPVISKDIELDDRWTDFRQYARDSGLRSCWSFPVFDLKKQMVATIATYYEIPSEPLAKELALFERLSSLLGVIFSNKQAEERIRMSNDRYLLATKATNDAIWDWNVSNNVFYWGEAFYTLFGYKPSREQNSFSFWSKNIHPDDRDRIIKGILSFKKGKYSKVWQDEYRFLNAQGKYVLVQDRGFLVFDQDGIVTRMVGSMQDITEKREMQTKLLKQEVDKQKMVAQAVLDAQEKERAEIGKELHDNVNQILSTARLYLELAKSDEKQRLPLIKRGMDNISNAVSEIRVISKSLVPPSIGDLGLVESIHDLVENIRMTRKLKVEFYHHEAIDIRLSDKQKLMFFRIIQEQVNNVLRHAEASNLIIELMLDGQNIHLTVTDDGKGFDKNNIKNKKGVGLSNIISRTELFDGKVHLVSAPGQGCTLRVEVPINNP